MSRRTRFYLDKRNAKMFGVCSGIGDYIGMDPLWVRVITVVATIAGVAFLPVIYIIVALVADDKPRGMYEDTAEETAFWQKVRVAPQRSIRDVRSRFRDIDRRLRDMEVQVTSPSGRLAAEIDRLR